MKHKKEITIISISAIIILLDQLIKFFVRQQMQPNQTIPLIKNVLHLTYVQNMGAGFGILQGQQWMIMLFSFLVLGTILFFYKKIPDEKIYNVLTAMIIGGVIGNLIDRTCLSYVVDFIDFRIWPVFNIADSCLTVAIVILLFISLTNKKSFP